jgi:hypothetical protein
MLQGLPDLSYEYGMGQHNDRQRATSNTKTLKESFLGKVNFLRRFIPNLAEIIKHITNMLKKGSEIKWTP